MPTISLTKAGEAEQTANIDIYGNTAKKGPSEIFRVELGFFKLNFCFLF